MDILEKQTEVQEDYVLDDLSVVKSVLMNFPKKIMLLEEQIFKVKQEKEVLLSRKKTKEYDILREVSKETYEIEVEKKVNKQGWTKIQKEEYIPEMIKESKQSYTNDIQRNTEMEKRAVGNKDHTDIRGMLDELSENIFKTEITLGYLKRLLNSAGYLVLLGHGKK